MEKSTFFLISVAPLVNLPLTRSPLFSYEYSEDLAVGDLVNIPFAGKTRLGVVSGSQPLIALPSKIKLKKINSVVKKNCLGSNQLKLAGFVADYYFCSLGVTLKYFIPKSFRSVRQRKSLAKVSPLRKPSPENLNAIQKKAISEIVNSVTAFPKKTFQKFLLTGPALSGKTEVCVRAIEKIGESQSEGQILVLVPEIFSLGRFQQRYGRCFRQSETVVISSQTAKGEYYKYWEKIRKGKARLILGTQMAVFLPFRNLRLIIIEEEQSVSYKQWGMKPRYDARRVAEKLSEIYECPLVRVSSAPLVETCYAAKKKHYQWLKIEALPSIKDFLAKPPIEIIDMKKEWWARRNFSLSSRLESEIAQKVKQRQKVLLFINRRGLSHFSICSSCRQVLRCPVCERALILESDGLYHCFSCQRRFGPLVNCQNCRSLSFLNIGTGTQKVEKDLFRLFPGAKILRIDGSILRNKAAFRNIQKRINSGDYEILIGTQIVLQSFDFFGLGLVAVLDADSMLFFPDFRTNERFFQLAAGFLSRVFEQKKGLEVKGFIQTFNPEQKMVKLASRLDYEDFYQEEIEERKIFNWPPFSRLIKLTLRSLDSSKIDKEAESVYNLLRKLPKGEKEFTVTPPHSPLVEKKRRFQRRQIIIKIKTGKQDQLREVIKKLGSNWTIDVDPVNIA